MAVPALVDHDEHGASDEQGNPGIVEAQELEISPRRHAPEQVIKGAEKHAHFGGYQKDQEHHLVLNVKLDEKYLAIREGERSAQSFYRSPSIIVNKMLPILFVVEKHTV